VDAGLPANLAALLQDYEECWNALDFARLERLWDPDEPKPTYLAEEIERLLVGYDAIRAYWAHTKATVAKLRIETAHPVAQALGHGITLLLFDMHHDSMMVGYEAQGFAPIGGDVRVTAAVRETAGGPRFVHYSEGSMGPLPFIRRVYQERARTRF
jgi:hypothetical protein